MLHLSHLDYGAGAAEEAAEQHGGAEAAAEGDQRGPAGGGAGRGQGVLQVEAGVDQGQAHQAAVSSVVVNLGNYSDHILVTCTP